MCCISIINYHKASFNGMPYLLVVKDRLVFLLLKLLYYM